nr:homoserine kinase [Pseudomonas aeruginosa PAO1]
MSVFTPLERSTLEAFLAPYDLGRLRDFRGIAEGSENSNFFVSLEHGEFVLTLVERGPVQDLPFFIELLDVLHEDGLPVPYALRTRDGEALRRLEGKPALLQPRLAGRHERQPNAHHCQEVAICSATFTPPPAGASSNARATVACPGCWNKVPTSPRDYRNRPAPCSPRPWRRSPRWMPSVQRCRAPTCMPTCSATTCCSTGPHLAGLIDFYNACSGWMLYDLAITLNDWCSNTDGSLDPARARALLAAYANRRPFTALEAEHWPSMLRVACVRFWLSRLIAAEAFAGQDVLIHDPAEFEIRLAQRQNVEIHLPFAL